MAGEGHPVIAPLSPAQIAMRAAYAVALAVSNIDSPATELALIAGANAGEIRRVHQVVAGADEWTEYAWDNASSAGTSSPYRLPGSSGQWRAVSGKYQDGDRYINGTLTLTGGLTVAGTTAFSGAFSVVDGNFSILGSSDATKIAKIEVDGFTTGTTRTITLPNASITVAGINLAQTFSATQTFAGIDATSIGATTRGTGLFTTIGANAAATLSSTLAVGGATTIDLGTGADPATALSGSALTLRNADATNVRLLGVAFGANGIIISGRGVGGTRALPTATTNGQVLCQFTGFGYNGTTYPTASSGLYSISAGSLWTASNQETLHEWRCTPSGSTTNTQRMVLYGTGNLCLGSAPADDGTNNLQVAGSAKITGATTLLSTLAVSGVTSISVATAFGLTVTNTIANSSTSGPFLGLREDAGAAMASGDRLGGILIGGARDAAHSITNSAGLSSFATEAWSGSASGANLVFHTTANGSLSRTDRMTIGQDGLVAIVGAATIGTTLGVTGAATLSSTLNVTGQSSLSGSANANACVTVAATSPAAIAGTTEYGFFCDFRSDSSATANTRAAFYRAGTAATAYTSAIVAGVVIGNSILGAGSTITRGYGIQLTVQSTATNNYGLVHSTGTPSTGNYFLYDDAGYASKVSGVWSFTDTTDASDSATASVVLAGGLAMAKGAWIGANAAAGIALNLNCAAANGAFIKYDSANTLRWQHGRVGSTHDWRLEAYDASAVLTDIPLTITNAAAGLATWTRPNIFPAATTAIPSIRLPHGTAPSSPTNGDIWTTTAGIFVRINGATIGPLT